MLCDRFTKNELVETTDLTAKDGPNALVGTYFSSSAAGNFEDAALEFEVLSYLVSHSGWIVSNQYLSFAVLQEIDDVDRGAPIRLASKLSDIDRLYLKHRLMGIPTREEVDEGYRDMDSTIPFSAPDTFTTASGLLRCSS
ncbi:hypothetical protein HD806DRAFT_531052 [Xylariaceae sp. AK1471]|nr:hypothetical protein HD806DRAFT_531052 [Xylariaceae sp. AK1471]